MDKLYFPDDELLPDETLYLLSAITLVDFDKAVTDWQENPPLPGYKNLLKAEDWEESGDG